MDGGITRGCIRYYNYTGPIDGLFLSGWLLERHPWLLQWLPSYRSEPELFQFTVPIWILVLPVMLLTAAAWRFDILAQRRARVGLCPNCRYDISAIPSVANCPECGAAPN